MALPSSSTALMRMMKERGIDIRRLRLAAICTVCVKPFLKEVNQMNDLLKGIGFVKDELAAHLRAHEPGRSRPMA